ESGEILSCAELCDGGAVWVRSERVVALLRRARAGEHFGIGATMEELVAEGGSVREAMGEGVWHCAGREPGGLADLCFFEAIARTISAAGFVRPSHSEGDCGFQHSASGVVYPFLRSVGRAGGVYFERGIWR